MKTINMSETFGSLVFNDKIMKQRLPHDTYKALKKMLKTRGSLTREIADVVANAMKDWAIEKGATHYTHWFQPMTGITAEKHDAFITPESQDGEEVIMEFSGKELIKGETDGSSFPSGGLRATFEARGYTAWDPTSNAFIKDGTLCIPTAFCSYTGEALDKKTPLLRSMDAVNVQAKRVLKLFGKDVQSVTPTVGPEQEYFLVDKNAFDRRPDLIFTGRTLFGARPSKGQEMEDHYFGMLKPRVAEYMRELDEELWKLGILAKTKHNEAAPAQHELAPLYVSANVAIDHNQLTMEMMRKVAARHDMACLLHEKPFAGVNGSGKHNNWSLSTDTGDNLLRPGSNPKDNAQFLLFLCAIMKAVDDHQDLLRITVSSAGNDHRLGALEAPPAIMSIFLGDEMTALLDSIEADTDYSQMSKVQMDIGVDVMPRIPKDTTDRNRTSPFAFTGNKFEFRSLGSSFSVAGPNIILNTIVADTLKQFADELELAEDFSVALNKLIRRTIKNHKRIIFNGNGYSQEWLEEAARRGLKNYATTPDALPHYTDEKNIALFSRHGVFTETEIHSRQEILLENYNKVIRIEALTMLDMVSKDILPAIMSYTAFLTDSALKKVQLGIASNIEKKMAADLSEKSERISELFNQLSENIRSAASITDSAALSIHNRDAVLASMQSLRAVVDETELMIPTTYWPYPSYGDLLFGIR